jgi:hypothetical protein
MPISEGRFYHKTVLDTISAGRRLPWRRQVSVRDEYGARYSHQFQDTISQQYSIWLACLHTLG